MIIESIVWYYLIFAFVMALLPFVLNYHLLYMPRSWSTGLICVLNIAIFAAGAYLVATFNNDSLIALIVGVVLLLGAAIVPAVIQKNIPKNIVARLLEWLVFYFVVGAVGLGIEASYYNLTHHKWEFYVVSLCLFATLAYPGFVFRQLWRRRA